MKRTIGWLRPRARLAITARMIFMVIVIAALSLLGGPTPARAQGGLVTAVDVQGSHRIDPDTVRSYMLVSPGEVADPALLDRSLKALYATGLFADINIRKEGDVLVVTVVENPVINRISFEGNLRVEDDTLSSETKLRPRLAYTRTRVQQDMQRVLEVYRLNGRFSTRVEPKVIQLPQNRVDLVFEIEEGPLTRIRAISFIGNKRYSDSDLRDVVQTREYAFWRILITTDTYDPDRLSFDRELLRRFYLAHGYVDFRVLSAVAELTPDREAFVVTFTIDEGQRYRMGKVDFAIGLSQVQADQLEPLITLIGDEWYDADLVEDQIGEMTDYLGRQGFAFADVRPQIKPNREAKTVDVTFAVRESAKVFVERIDVVGNVRTLDKVIRREFELVEGDAFNSSKLRRSRRRIRNLGFFGSVKVTKAEGSAPDRTVITAEVEEQPTGEISFGVGYSTIDSVVADFGIRERNLLGRGQDLHFKFQGAARKQEFDIGFTEPYLFDRDLTGGIDLFRISSELQEESSFDESRTGGALRFGFDLARDLRQSVSYQLKRTEIRNVADTASRLIKEQEGKNTVSSISQTLTWDKRDSRINPTEGYFIRVSNDLAGFGGDTRFLRTKLRGGYFVPLSEDWVMSFRGESGYVAGLGEDIEIAERFFLGGSKFRGFARSGLGPRDSGTDDALGGNSYYVGTVEMSFPIGLPTDVSVKAFVFSDFGSLWNIDDSGSEILDSSGVRASLGTGIAWSTGIGQVRLDFAQAFLKEEYDDTESFRFSFGTRF